MLHTQPLLWAPPPGGRVALATAVEEEELALGWAVSLSVMRFVVWKQGLLWRQGERFSSFALEFGLVGASLSHQVSGIGSNQGVSSGLAVAREEESPQTKGVCGKQQQIPRQSAQAAKTAEISLLVLQATGRRSRCWQPGSA